MFQIKQGKPIVELDAWGTVADLGAEILEGDCLAFGRMVHGAPNDPISCAYFAATRGKFLMTYPFTEHAIVVEGELTLTDQGTGASVRYGPGDGWFIEKGAQILWEVHSDRFVKNYLAIA